MLGCSWQRHGTGSILAFNVELDALRRSEPAPTNEKPRIRGARISPPQRLPPVAPPGAVEIKRPDGRKTRFVVARHQDMLALMRVNEANTERAFDAIAHNGRAIDQLAASQGELADRLTKLQANGDLALLRGLIKGLADLKHRMERGKRLQDRALAAHKRSVQKQRAHQARQARALESQTRIAQVQKLHEAAASIQSVALARRDDLLTAENLQLAANQLFWSFAPEIFEALGFTESGATSPLAWLAPLGNLITGAVIIANAPEDLVPDEDPVPDEEDPVIV